MRPIRTIATALLVASVAVAGCARSQPDQAASPTSGPPAATAAPTPKAPAPTPGARPRILSVTTTPTLRRDGGFLVLPAGAGTITFHVQAVNAHKVRFYLSPTGTNGFALATLIGDDRDGRDGWTATWHYKDEPLLAHLTVRATGPGGTSPDTLLDLYHPEPA